MKKRVPVRDLLLIAGMAALPSTFHGQNALDYRPGQEITKDEWEKANKGETTTRVIRYWSDTKFMIIPEYKEYLKKHPFQYNPQDKRTFDEQYIAAYNEWSDNRIANWCASFADKPSVVAAKGKYKYVAGEFAMSCDGYSENALYNIDAMVKHFQKGVLIKAGAQGKFNTFVPKRTPAEYREATNYLPDAKGVFRPMNAIAGAICSGAHIFLNGLGMINGVEVKFEPHSLEIGRENAYNTADGATAYGSKDIIATNNTGEDLYLYMERDPVTNVLYFGAFTERQLDRSTYWGWKNDNYDIVESNDTYDQWTRHTRRVQYHNGVPTGKMQDYGVHTYQGLDLPNVKANPKR